MGIVERREREREEVRRKILDAAHELFVREGYDRVTMRRIAEAIEYSPTTGFAIHSRIVRKLRFVMHIASHLAAVDAIASR